MNATAPRVDLLPPSVPTFAVLLMAAAGLGLWVLVRRITRLHRDRLPVAAFFGARAGAAVAAAWTLIQAFGRFVAYGCQWPLWAMALAAGIAVETAALLYQRERRVAPRRLGLLLTLLRGAAIALLAAMILQPVAVRSVTRNIVRRVAVLLDESDSMRFVDRQWTTGERLDLAVHARLLKREERPLPALESLAGLRAVLKPWLAAPVETNRAPAALQAILEAGGLEARELQTQVGAVSNRGGAGGEALGRLQRQVRDATAPAFLEALTASAANRLERTHLAKLGDALDQLAEAAVPASAAADTLCWDGLDAARQSAILAYTTTTRLDLAHDILTRTHDGACLMDRLAGRYDIDLMRLGRGAERMQLDALRPTGTASNGVSRFDWAAAVASNAAPAAVRRAFEMRTDYTAALEQVLRDVPSEQLAGVLVISDGRHNGDAAIDPVARRLGGQGVPVCSVRIGGSRLPFDLALADVTAPESVYLGDRVRVKTIVRATGAKGRTLRLRMLRDDTVIAESEPLDVSTDDWQRDVRLMHEPDSRGIFRYELRLDVQEGELFSDNNAWSIDVAVSDDRTNVLLVDDYPRWEFRYLRNLFFGRDKSVHLQYYLVHPDRIASVKAATPLPPASAGRAFGDAEAGGLPENRDEWRKFDVIILGDLDATVLTPEVLEEIRYCVAERGALLVTIAGQRAMPHGHEAGALLAEMLPIRYTPDTAMARTPPEEAYRLTLTPSGLAHPVMQQSPSLSENEAIWTSIPELRWRHAIEEAKPGADVLAYAVPVEPDDAPPPSVDVRGAVERLDAELRRRSRDALIVAQGYGRGKVLALTFDCTWRLRYCVGDTYHHRFWGQVLRWGAGEKLRDGTDALRVGTDQVTYGPTDPVRLIGRVLDENFAGVNDARLTAALKHEDRDAVRTIDLAYRKDSNGMYEAALPALEEPGRYTVTLLRHDGGLKESVETSFLVVTARRPVEMAEVSATSDTLASLGRWTGGRVVTPAQLDELVEAFGEGRRVLHEPLERPLWDSPWVYLVLLGLVSGEWVLRKKGGLA